jgi:hypothetical protein
MKLRIEVPLVCLIAALGCAGGIRAPDPAVGPLTGVVVTRAQMRMPGTTPELRPIPATSAMLARITDDPDRPEPDELIQSDSLVGGYVVFLDVPPGRYVVVTTSYVQTEARSSPRVPANDAKTGPPDPSEFGSDEAPEIRHRAYLAEDLIRRLAVEVLPGEIAFAGRMDLQLKRLRVMDAAQTYFHQRLNPARPRAPTFEPGGSGAFDSGENSYSAKARSVDRSREALQAMQDKVTPTLAEAGWRGPAQTPAIAPDRLVYPAPEWAGSGPATGTRRVGEPVRVELLVTDAANTDEFSPEAEAFSQVLAAQLEQAGFGWGADDVSLYIDVQLEQIESGRRAKRPMSPGAAAALLRYAVEIRGASGELLGRSRGEEALDGQAIGSDVPGPRSNASILETLRERSAKKIVDYVRLVDQEEE